MGSVISIGLDALPEALARGEKRMRQAIARGALAGAHRGRAVIVKRTPTDMGQLRASWRVKPGAEEFSGLETDLATLVNDAPHIAMVELGSRPHRVSPEGWAAIYAWVHRHYRGGQLGGTGATRRRSRKGPGPGPFQGDDPVIAKITNAIVWRIRRYGTKPRLFVKNSLDELRAVMAAELERAMATVERDMSRGKGRR